MPWLALHQSILRALAAISEPIVQHYAFTPSHHLTSLGDSRPHFGFVAFAEALNCCLAEVRSVMGLGTELPISPHVFSDLLRVKFGEYVKKNRPE
jgi:hypothetical protein